MLAIPQADLEIHVYMELPIGFDAQNRDDHKFYVLIWSKTSRIQLVCEVE